MMMAVMNGMAAKDERYTAERTAPGRRRSGRSAPAWRRPGHFAAGLCGRPDHDRLPFLHLVGVGDDLRQAAAIELKLAADMLPDRAGLAQLGRHLLAVD